ncbi:phosphate ABC transporter permease subunit PstC [Parvimonas micra]|uniref:phosphate ABC transporter permease subunit PstC n=1 Tax=Parvimonas micra TaxID=33033 RepID=UPI0020031330|nr:phosphate ABC transporter permease subunit PstC [Parvimonas micra]MCK6130490.1 phosphate ABC transporter permease subunit PstC [Parvimonas micra]MCK6136137.1 phosphate ABC transporter permease subunit PstC [Parvimonas micra]MCK6137608.1 phosphate ABC transporter permease subunit PstC [Parvimonas micra]MCK6154136.1 phosphate ABC transporter permease subunit PstC [Parvimonas micra]
MKNKFFKYTVYIFTLFTILLLFTLIVFLYNQSLPFFLKNNFLKFIFGRVWDATEVSGSFGIFNILLASVFISILACIISLPIAIGTALYLCFYTKNSKVFLIWLINILAGIPSIIYGFFGMIIIVKNIERIFKISAGESVLAGSIILSIMILPYFVSNLIETIELIKKKYQRDSDALGISKEYFIRKVVLKKLHFSILTGFMISFSRAIGETMAVMMVIGNAPIFPKLLSKAQTIPSLIALEIGMSEVYSEHYYALFASGFILLILVLIINILLFIINRKSRNYDKI